MKIKTSLLEIVKNGTNIDEPFPLRQLVRVYHEKIMVYSKRQKVNTCKYSSINILCVSTLVFTRVEYYTTIIYSSGVLVYLSSVLI